MHAAARPFLGEHDFAAFCRAREGASTVRTLLDLDWQPASAIGDGPGLAEFRIRSDAFCHSMVRALVGSFLAVGEGSPAGRAAGRAAGCGSAGTVCRDRAAHGLTLAAVGYPLGVASGARYPSPSSLAAAVRFPPPWGTSPWRLS